MAGWKKVIVSGSTANLANVQVDGLTSGVVTGAAGNLTTTAVDGTGNIVAATALSGVSSSIDTRIDAFSGSVATEIDAIQSDISNLGSTYATDSELTTVSESIDVRIDAFSGSVATEIDALQSDIAGLDSTYATDTQLSTVSASIDTRIDALESAGATDAELTAVSGAIDTRLDAFSGSVASEINAIEGDVSGLTTDSGSFSSRLTSLEGSDFNFNLSIGADSGADDVVADGSTINFVGGTNLNSAVADDQITFNLDDQVSLTGITGSLDGNAGTATTLQTARNIGGVSFNGSADINLPGVNTAGNQNTTGNAATATQLASSVTIGGVSFDGSANINLPGVNIAGNQNTTGNAATATALANSRNFSITGDGSAAAVGFDGSGNVALSLVLASGSVGHGQLEADAVDGSKIADNAIANEHLADSAVGNSELASNAVTNAKVASNAAIAHTKIDFDGSTILSGSAGVSMGGDISGNADNATVTAVQGVALTSGEATQLANIGTSTISATQWGYVGGMDQDVSAAANPRFADLTVANLTVTGTQTQLQVTNLNVEDQFILVNSGSAAQDAGLVFAGQGAAFGWDESANRFALDYAGATFDQTAITSDAFVAAVVTSDDANYRKNGNIRIDGDDVYIYTE